MLKPDIDRAISKLVSLPGIRTQIRVSQTAELACNGPGFLNFPLKSELGPEPGQGGHLQVEDKQS